MPTALDPVCSSCGSPSTAATQISDLENQVHVLTEQSIDALNRLASYEEEIRQLRMQRHAANATPTAIPAEPQHSYNNSIESSASSNNGYGLNRFTSFRVGRKPSSSSTIAPLDAAELQMQLQKETKAREEAENKANLLSSELEDLSANLFEQANEMVATERRARSRLEEKVATLEQRDKDKSRRLEKIEGALKRMDRVKTLLAPPSPPT